MGKGGAIRVQRGKFILEDSKFINNSASALGGSIFIDNDSTVTITRTTFDNSVHWKTGMDDIIHSKGNMKIQQTEFHVKAVGKESLDKIQLVPLAMGSVITSTRLVEQIFSLKAR